MRLNNFDRVIILISFVFVSIFVYFKVSAKDINIFSIEKNLPLKDSDPVFHDYYIDGGSIDGIKKNMVINVYRRISMQNNVLGQELQQVEISVGQIKIIHVQKSVSIGRAIAIQKISSSPIFYPNSIMKGDFLDLASAYFKKNKKEIKKRKISKK